MPMRGLKAQASALLQRARPWLEHAALPAGLFLLAAVPFCGDLWYGAWALLAMVAVVVLSVAACALFLVGAVPLLPQTVAYEAAYSSGLLMVFPALVWAAGATVAG